jgi:hypothetical protein
MRVTCSGSAFQLSGEWEASRQERFTRAALVKRSACDSSDSTVASSAAGRRSAALWPRLLQTRRVRCLGCRKAQ